MLKKNGKRPGTLKLNLETIRVLSGETLAEVNAARIRTSAIFLTCDLCKPSEEVGCSTGCVNSWGAYCG